MQTLFHSETRNLSNRNIIEKPGNDEKSNLVGRPSEKGFNLNTLPQQFFN